MSKLIVIQLLNKIAKGEEVPEKIKWGNDEWKYSNGASKNYYTDYEDLFSVIDGSNLNDEIEVIEDEEPDLFEMIEDMKNKPKHIEEIEEIELLGQGDNWLETKTMKEHIDMELNPYIIKTISKNFEKLYDKQCELTKAVNYLLDKEEK